jgi:hypothetical protein
VRPVVLQQPEGHGSPQVPPLPELVEELLLLVPDGVSPGQLETTVPWTEVAVDAQFVTSFVHEQPFVSAARE